LSPFGVAQTTISSGDFGTQCGLATLADDAAASKWMTAITMRE
jgi:hypothetical protein